MPCELEILQTEPFAGDEAVASRVAALVKEYGIRSIIETGTYHGATTRWLATQAPTMSVESNAENYQEAVSNLRGVRNVKLILGSSAQRMTEMIRKSKRPILFFLDAHWGKSWPLLHELAAIARARNTRRSVIVIHDFKVSGTDLGFDSYGGKDLDLLYVAESMDRIYGRCGSCVEFNNPETAGGLRRGVAYFTPKR